MRYAFIIITIFHALIHLLGFVKGFEFKEVKALTMPISKTAAIWWLLATCLLLTYSISFIVNHKYQWIFGLMAVVVSQLLIIFFWKVAKFGTITNIIIFSIVLVAFGQHQFNVFVAKETAKVLRLNQTNYLGFITERTLENLPTPLKRWLKLVVL